MEWALVNPGDEDVWWRLTPVARGLVKWPWLAGPLLTAVERAMWALPAEETGLNSQSEVDGLLKQMCKSLLQYNGVAGARLDDVLLLWLHRPESLGPNCSPGTHYVDLVSRITSMFVVPGRLYGDCVRLLDRLETWIDQWRWHGEERRDAHRHVAHVRNLLEGRGWSSA